MHLVIGASGNVGREVTRLLLEAGEQVRVLTRNPGRAVFPDAVEVVRRHRIDLPYGIRNHLERGADGTIPETPKPGDKQLQQ